MRKRGAFRDGDWSLTNPVSDVTVIVARDSDRTVRFRFSEHLWREDRSNAFQWGQGGNLLGSGYAAWKMIRKEALKIAPENGRTIDRPSSETIAAWAEQTMP
jgi:hypothetical protein